jgi:pyruvate kinase
MVTANVDIGSWLSEIGDLRKEIERAVEAHRAQLDTLPPERQASARNLIHYLTLRRHDLRGLQSGLAAIGMSSLGRVEAHVLPTLDAVLRILEASTSPTTALDAMSVEEFQLGERILRQQTEQLLGPPSRDRSVRIMVTMPSEAAHDYALVRDLVQAGMNCMRINCAHGDKAEWLRMVEHVRRAEVALKLPCKVLMDLAGAKLRTGPVTPGPAVVRARPQRDDFGRAVASARVWLTPAQTMSPPPAAADAVLPVTPEWLGHLEVGSVIKFRDARDAKRKMTVAAIERGGVWAELMKTAYFVPGTVLRCATAADERGEQEALVGDLPRLDPGLRLDIGDALMITRDPRPGHAAQLDQAGRLLAPATIACSLPQVFDDIRAGEPIWLDDGKFGGMIERVTATELHIRITHAPPGGARLGGDKGINLPDSNLRVPALTDKDLIDLSFVVQHADLVGLSFVNNAEDVDLLQRHIAELGPRRPAIMLKIETKRGFEHLPEVLLAAMKTPACGVMIARGDLAVECGFERLAEVQEEILWVCEAAHVPVVWATQVLEALAKQGMPSRAEITDAAMGHRAECVMLNKGPHILAAVRTLDDILKRMEAHQFKKRALLRELRLARGI